MSYMKIHYFDELRSRIFRTHVSGGQPKYEVVKALGARALEPMENTLSSLDTQVDGLSAHAVEQSFQRFGPNIIVREKRKNWAIRLFRIYINPLTLLLSVLVAVALVTSDLRTAIIVGCMILISVFIRFFQENRAYNSAEALRKMVHTTCTVMRAGKKIEIRLEEIVLGDIVYLSAGDIVPADVRVIESKDLFANQSLLTGEAIPVEKHAVIQADANLENPLEFQNLCFMGANIESGTACVVVIATGSQTYFGSLAKDIVGEREITSFDKGISRFTWLMIIFMSVMVPAVFIINGITKHNWGEAFLFALSVAVGLTPEMLPALVAVNLTRGALDMAKKKVIVKRLSSIQNFGAMNVLCSDKTGTLTRNEVVLVKHINIDGEDSLPVLHAAFLNSLYQTGFKNLLDGAVLRHGEAQKIEHIRDEYTKIDEIPFDFQRRRLSIITANTKGEHTLFTKGAVEEMIVLCTQIEEGDGMRPLENADTEKIMALEHKLNLDGFQVIAVAKRAISEPKKSYDVEDEHDLIFLGFMAFLDPPKESAALAIEQLKQYGVTIKVLTGDNEYVTKRICHEVGLMGDTVLLGPQIAHMSDDELKAAVLTTDIFAKLLPEHKRRVVLSLQANGCVVGFLGDGINDAPALRTADVGISVNSATDIAKESADIILLEMSLSVLGEGVLEGRKVFGNIIKYIKMGASSNFGNMFSVLGASILFPFLPMLPVQILTNNLLYDFSQTTIPTDNVDPEYIEKPRKWHIQDIGRFMLFIGPMSSIFDYATFFVMWFVFRVNVTGNASLFQTGWFVESLISQTLIIHVIRSRKIPFLQSRASKPLLISTVLVMAAAIILTYSPLAPGLSFVHLPWLFWPILVAMMLCYIALTQLMKMWYIRKFGYN